VLLGLPAPTPSPRGPIIDVHMHGYPAEASFAGHMPNPISGKATGLATGEDHLQQCLAQMERLGIVTGFVSGADGDRLAVARHWHDAAPTRIVAGVGLRGSPQIPLPDLGLLREALEKRLFGVLGEVSAQYAGLTLSDPKFDPYLSLAEELDVPVAVHTGISYPRISYEACCKGFRTALGNPVHVEEALNRHPRLRVSLMHAGWPYLQETVALMSVYPQVYADVAVIDWAVPREEFHEYLRALVRAGLGKRLMFGSDQMEWPDAIGMAVDGIDSATFLTAAEKRDIFYNNAARFFRLPPSPTPLTTP
jgi:hypothetical protein